MSLLFIIALMTNTIVYTLSPQPQKPLVSAYEQETERALQPLNSITSRLSALRNDKITIQAIEAEKKRIKQQEDSAAQKQKRVGAGGLKSRGASVGNRSSGRRPSYGRGYGSSYGHGRSSYGSYSPFGGGRPSSSNRGFGRSPYQEHSSAFNKQPLQQSSQSKNKNIQTPQTKKTNTTPSSPGYTSKNKNKKSKSNDEKEIKENQLQQIVKKLNHDLSTIIAIISTKTKSSSPEKDLLTAYEELQRPSQNKFESLASGLSSYVRQLNELPEAEKKYFSAENKNLIAQLNKATPYLVRFSLAPNQPTATRVMTMLINDGIHLIENKKLKSLFEQEESRLVKNIESSSNSLERALNNLKDPTAKDNQELAQIKQKLQVQLNTLANNMPTEWSQKRSQVSKLLKKVSGLIIPEATAS